MEIIKDLMKSSFLIKAVNDIFILLIDLDFGRSVTNDAAQVIEFLQNKIPGGIGSRIVYYRDTTGRYDQLKTKNGKFNGFASCAESQQNYLSKIMET